MVVAPLTPLPPRWTCTQDAAWYEEHFDAHEAVRQASDAFKTQVWVYVWIFARVPCLLTCPMPSSHTWVVPHSLSTSCMEISPPKGPLLPPFFPPLLLQRIYPAIAAADPAECWLFLKGLNEAAFGFSKWGVPPSPGATAVQQDTK